MNIIHLNASRALVKSLGLLDVKKVNTHRKNNNKTMF